MGGRCGSSPSLRGQRRGGATVRGQELLHQYDIDEAQGKMFLNRLFEDPKWDSTFSHLVLDLCRLNKPIQTFILRMLVAQLCLALSSVRRP